MPLWGHGTMWVFGRQVRETVGLAWAWPTWAVRWPAWAVLCDVRICGCSRPWVGMIPWRREWLPIPVFLPRKSYGQRILLGYSPWGCRRLNTTEQLTLPLWKYFHPFYRLSFHLVNSFYCCAEAFKADVVPFTYFCFYYLCFW